MANNIYIGKRIGKLIVISSDKSRLNGYAGWVCKCDCGNTVVKYTNYLNNKRTTKQCNICAAHQRALKISRFGEFSLKNKRLIRIGVGAKKRCEDKSNENYGGRGIKFSFDSVKDFADWSLANGYRDDLTIERKDVNGDYSPDNCCWISKEEQARNKTTTPHFMGHDGYRSIAKFFGITVKSLQAMVYKHNLTFNEIYQKSKKDPMFHASLYEKTRELALKRKDGWALNKEQVEEIIKRISNGEKRTPLSKEFNVDLRTLDKSIIRYKNGYY